jgi:peptidoglycan-associated lipoprotein
MGKVFVALSTLSIALLLAFTGGCGDKPKGPNCKVDKDCKSPLVCSSNKCVECRDDSQCSKGKKCVANACIVKPQCEKDDQCPAGQVCQAGACKPCASDGECGPGGRCEAGQCQRPKKCTQNEDCADDEDCINGLCLRADGGSNVDAGCQLQTIYFAFDDSSIQTSERDRLDGNNSCIGKNKEQSVLVIGHTDTSGTEEYNIALSERRAQSVADYLSRLGTDPAKMQVVPKGETEPTGLGDDKDRRVEFKWR